MITQMELMAPQEVCFRHLDALDGMMWNESYQLLAGLQVAAKIICLCNMD